MAHQCRVRFLVALPLASDLLLCAKHLFVTASGGSAPPTAVGRSLNQRGIPGRLPSLATGLVAEGLTTDAQIRECWRAGSEGLTNRGGMRLLRTPKGPSGG